ncbi:hypothetical protein SARC_17309 [Sphaeroforma arctica JP610]|uniref:Uncharacterized protein n=1 Tax=Sphaeroforma arctica JP610 TaxID=667725 RepID=A0A0L0F0Q0_9EUKA|nr:hypothetical protein SARC_17309 [Sphaeroforma arctica JP610]KNC70169.1 hypothetical protein SARC_17309 [Sphaeroforma arctica JP610]|eukprot:XP_014144071.1 hypothetical protein SARC_17309 [Sphaeroforma arctica JP610]
MAGRHLFHTSANRRKLDTDESAHTQPTNTQHPTTNTQHPTTEPTTTTTATTTATATETPDKTVPTQTAVQRIAQLDQKALELYEAHPLCFRNFPIDLINWRVTQRPAHKLASASRT